MSSAAPIAANASEPARLALRTGSIAPVMHDTSWRLEVVGRALDGDFEILELELPSLESGSDAPDRLALPSNIWERARVQVTSDATALGFIGLAQDPEAPTTALRQGARASVPD